MENKDLEQYYNDIVGIVSQSENPRKIHYDILEIVNANQITIKKTYAELKEYWNQKEHNDLIKKYNQRKQYLSSIIYKIPLYSFVGSNQPYCFEDDQFDNVFTFSNNIFATVIDKNHVKEITTGMVFPIVDLSKNNDKFSSSIIKYDNLTEKDILFAISKNRILMTSKADLKKLVIYLKAKRNIIEYFIQKYQISAKTKIKK